MSATGRNLKGRERHEDDFYETPAWCTRAILPHLRFASKPRAILDAGCGTGAILRTVGEHFDEEVLMIGVDKSVERVRQANEYEPYPDRDHFYEVFDFLKIEKPESLGEVAFGIPHFDLVIANPPYNDAEAFVEHALDLARPAFGSCLGTVCFLLRLNWLASQKRAAFHRAHPSDVFVLPKRPSFTNGGTDATEYAWFVWGPTHVEECLNGGFRGNRWRILDVEVPE